ncbi:hypothetical protein PAXRUDRAFT_171310, partial [Paxillus rubicundulus Ve08.2h10]
LKAFKTWFYNQCQSGANHSHIKVGCSWTARVIMQKTYKEINEVIWERYGKRPGTKKALLVYQKAVQRVVNKLMQEERDKAKNTVVKWNLDCRPLNEVFGITS